MSMRDEFACAASGCDGCTLCQPEKWLKHYQTENARLREALEEIAKSSSGCECCTEGALSREELGDAARAALEGK